MVQVSRYLVRGNSLETKQIQRLIVIADYKPASECGGQPVEKISIYWAGSIFHIFNISDDIIGYSMNFLSGPHSNRHEGCAKNLPMSFISKSDKNFKFMSSGPASASRTLGKGKFLF